MSDRAMNDTVMCSAKDRVCMFAVLTAFVVLFFVFGTRSRVENEEPSEKVVPSDMTYETVPVDSGTATSDT